MVYVLYGFFVSYVYIGFLSLVLSVVLFCLWLRSRKKMYRLSMIFCSILFFVLFGVFIYEHFGRNAVFFDYCEYGIYDGVVLENESGTKYLYDADDPLKIGIDSGYIELPLNVRRQLGIIMLSLSEVSDFKLFCRGIEINGIDCEFEVGDRVRCLVKRRGESPVSIWFVGRRTLEALGSYNRLRLDWWSVKFSEKVGKLSDADVDDVLNNMNKDLYFSCNIPGYGHFDCFYDD